MNDIDNPFTGKHLIPRSPPPPSKSSPTHSQSPTESPVKPTQLKIAVSSPKKKIIRPQNPTQNRQKDIPIEIHVAPKLINPNPSKLKGKAGCLSSSRLWDHKCFQNPTNRNF